MSSRMRGGFWHNRILAAPLDTAFRKAGGRTWLEIGLREKQGEIIGFIDLLALIDSRLIAVEVELSSKRVARDLTKARMVRASELWFVVPNVRARRSVVRRLSRLPKLPFGGAIYVLTLGQALQRVANCFPLISGPNAPEKQSKIKDAPQCKSSGPT